MKAWTSCELVGLGCGEAITSLGESASETALLLRAGVGNVRPSDFIDAKGERVLLCTSPALPPDLPGAERLLALAVHALARLHQRMVAAEETGRRARTPVILVCLPERLAASGSSGKAELARAGLAFVEGLRRGLPPEWRGARIETFPFGGAAGAFALQRALQLVTSGEAVLWGGVDTCADWEVLEALEREGRLMSADNVDALRPGEAAAFVALDGKERGDAAVLAIGSGQEPHPPGAERPCLSDGFSQALDAAATVLRTAERRCAAWMMDTSHESYATHEVQNLLARFGHVLGADAELQMPLKELGHVGAAAMPLLVVLAMQAWAHGVARDDCAIITCSSDRGLRGAVLVGSRLPECAIRARAALEVSP